MAKAGCDTATYFCDSTEWLRLVAILRLISVIARRAAKAGCDSATYFCDSSGVAKAGCDTATYFCDTSGVAKAGCDSATYFCDSSGVAKAGCDSAIYFCDTSGVAKADCDPITVNCHTGLAHMFDAAGNIVVLAYDAPDKDVALATDVLAKVRARYTETPANATVAQAVTAIKANEKYQFSGSANRIGAAYAYARGHTGEGIIVSNMGERIDSTRDELTSAWVPGYRATDKTAYHSTTAPLVGICVDAGGCGEFTQSTHLASIIVGGNNGGAMTQGTAYNAEIKVIDIVTDNIFQADTADKRTKLNLAIAAASGSAITVMNNGWDVSAMGTYDDSGTDRYYNDANALSAIMTEERTEWKKAVADAATGRTVVVFAAGDYGYNSENGEVRLYMDTDRTTKLFKAGSATEQKTVAWSSIAGGGGNQASSHARLASVETETLGGKWLTVIALKDDNEIWQYSNGCGDTKTYCLGAPGVDINAAIPGGYEERDGTAQAAAHVSGAVAVLKSAFPHLTPAELVSVILATADDLGVAGVDEVYGHGALNLGRATEPVGSRTVALPSAPPSESGLSLDNSGITLPTSFGGALDGFTVGFIDDYNRAYIGNPARITQASASFTLADTLATWDSPELQSIQLDSNSKMQFTNYDDSEHAKDTLIFTHKLPNHTIAFSYNEEHKIPDLMLAGDKDEMHFQKIRPIASDLMQVNSTHKLGKAWNVKNALTSGEFDTGNRFNEAMANLNYTSENRNLTIGAGTLKEYGQFLGASGTGAYQLSDATSSQVTHLAVTQNLPLNSAIKLKYTGFKTEVDMRYNNFANINDLTANEYQLAFAKQQILGKNDSLNFELIQPFAVTDGTLQQSTVLGYTADGDYNNVTQNYNLKPTNRRQQIRMTWQNQINLERKTRFFLSMQYENHVDNVRDKEDSSILGGISTKF